MAAPAGEGLRRATRGGVVGVAATKQDIAGWFDDGVRGGATHLIVVCDDFDHEDYPVYVKPGEDARQQADAQGQKSMQRVMEVYALHLDKWTQLSEPRAFHYEAAPTVTEEPVSNVAPKRNQTISVRFTEEEREIVRRAAGAVGKSTVVWVRAITLMASRMAEHATPLPEHLEHDAAVERAAELLSGSLHRCSPELRQKLQNLVRDLCR